MIKILAIDDIKENLVAIKETIEDLMPDYLVLTAQSGKEGLKIARDEHPDTILLDIVMPEMDGYEVCKKLKEDELTRHIPIIVLTAIRIDTESKIQGLEVGADAFLSKPIDTEELIAQINVMLRIKKAEDESGNNVVSIPISSKLLEVFLPWYKGLVSELNTAKSIPKSWAFFKTPTTEEEWQWTIILSPFFITACP